MGSVRYRGAGSTHEVVHGHVLDVEPDEVLRLPDALCEHLVASSACWEPAECWMPSVPATDRRLPRARAHGALGLTPPPPSGALTTPTSRWSQVRNQGPNGFYSMVATATVVQVVTVDPGEVVILPLETCQWLVVHAPQFVPFTVVPDVLAIAHDSATGLDYWDAPSNAPWGLVAATGTQWFDAEGFNANAAGSEEHARLFVDGNSRPYLRI